jgi:hypothetical protein
MYKTIPILWVLEILQHLGEKVGFVCHVRAHRDSEMNRGNVICGYEVMGPGARALPSTILRK